MQPLTIQNYRPHPDLLKNRFILVTGAASGIGQAVSFSFAQYGANVILLDKNQDKLNETYDAIEKETHTQPLLYPLDLLKANQGDYEAMAEGIYQSLGHLDGIVHVASHFDNLSPLSIQSLDQFEHMLKINVLAPFALTKSCLKLLEKSDSGSVIFTSSSAAYPIKPFWGSHGVSKVATDTLMQIWASEIDAPTIRFNSLIPGPVQSPQRKKSHPGEWHERLPELSSLMPWYLYLMDPQHTMITGQIIDSQLTDLK
jgi:NAD(P)-dependent dehydrogenase (short-subunit alcohol dehydrogenase family)